ncbi:MAG: hypothetical protein MK225_04960, partial [Candidatus Marinimicrobia bacterium]|nr:hypothetical protein [Candidatus Neomarinimicrobiota bacterium]
MRIIKIIIKEIIISGGIILSILIVGVVGYAYYKYHYPDPNETITCKPPPGGLGSLFYNSEDYNES